MKTVRGTIHGNTIHLEEALGLVDGTQVEVSIKVYNADRAEPGAGLRRCAGILADSWTDEDDEILEQLQQDRLGSISRELPD